MLNVNGKQIDRVIFKRVRESNGETIYASDMYGLKIGDVTHWARPCTVTVYSNQHSPALTLCLTLRNPAPGAPARDAQSTITIDGNKTFTAYAGDAFKWELRSSDPSYRVNSASGNLSIELGEDGVLTDSYTKTMTLGVTRLADGPELICRAGTNDSTSTDRNLLIEVENPNSKTYKFYGKAIVRWQTKSGIVGDGSRLRRLTVHSFGGNTSTALSEASPTPASAGGLASERAGSAILPGGGIVSPGGGGVVIPPGGIVGPGGGIIGPGGGGIIGPGGGGFNLPYELDAPDDNLEPYSWVVQGAFWPLSYISGGSGGTTPPSGVLPVSVITQASAGDLNLGYKFGNDNNAALVNEFNSLAPDGEKLSL